MGNLTTCLKKCLPFIPFHNASAASAVAAAASASSSSSTLPVHNAPASSSTLCSPSFIPLHGASVSSSTTLLHNASASSSSLTVPLHNVSTSSSSSSSSPSTSYYCHSYDVFINHHGSDVKKTFATHLYRSLHSYGLQPFLDNPEMQVGHDILSQIKAVIKGAYVHIAIFSPNYAESYWCLEELVLMKKSGVTIIPVFYNVKPSELRWTGKDKKDGTYEKCLRNHEEKQRHDSQTIQNWRDALSHAASLSSLELEEFNGNEEELLDKVVQSVLKTIPKPPLDVAKYPTGLETKLQDLEWILSSQKENEGSEVKVVAIFGLGGLGKTTLATEFFNKNMADYNRSSFLFDLREHSARGKLNILQSKLIKYLKFKDVNILSCAEGKGILERYLSNCHALIVLDDVGEGDQLDAFLPILRRVLDPKSLILVTSRNWHALTNARISETSIYKLNPLDRSESQELLCKYAFFEAHPPKEFRNLVDGFVTASGSLPLSLIVFGGLVCGQDKPYWEEQLG